MFLCVTVEYVVVEFLFYFFLKRYPCYHWNSLCLVSINPPPPAPLSICLVLGVYNKINILFWHILLIKDNSIFVNHLRWYWIRHYVFDWFISLMIVKVFCLFSLLSQDFCYSGFICFTRLSFISHKKTREGVDVKTGSKVKV